MRDFGFKVLILDFFLYLGFRYLASLRILNFPPMRPPGILVKTKVDKLSKAQNVNCNQ